MPSEDLLGHLASALEALNAVEARYALIGGFAADLRGCNRITRDLDFVVRGDVGRLIDIRSEFGKRGFEFRGPEGGIVLGDVTLWRFWKQLETVFADAPVDLQMATAPFHCSVVERALPERCVDVEVRVARPEDLIILKLIAFRPLDRADAITMIAVTDEALDWPYMESWADQLDVRDRLEEVRREAEHA